MIPQWFSQGLARGRSTICCDFQAVYARFRSGVANDLQRFSIGCCRVSPGCGLRRAMIFKWRLQGFARGFAVRDAFPRSSAGRSPWLPAHQNPSALRAVGGQRCAGGACPSSTGDSREPCLLRCRFEFGFAVFTLRPPPPLLHLCCALAEAGHCGRRPRERQCR